MSADAQNIDAVRGRVVDQLTAHYAADALSLDELERRLDAAYAATSRHALDALLRDLPDQRALAMVAPERGAAAHPYAAQRDGPPTRIMAFMSETHRTGHWFVPRRVEVLSIMADTKIDLREASLTGPITDIEINALMTNVVVIVPEGVRVVNDVTAFMASSRDRTGRRGQLPSSAPVIRLRGWSVMAEVTVRHAE